MHSAQESLTVQVSRPVCVWQKQVGTSCGRPGRKEGSQRAKIFPLGGTCRPSCLPACLPACLDESCRTLMTTGEKHDAIGTTAPATASDCGANDDDGHDDGNDDADDDPDCMRQSESERNRYFVKLANLACGSTLSPSSALKRYNKNTANRNGSLSSRLSACPFQFDCAFN